MDECVVMTATELRQNTDSTNAKQGAQPLFAVGDWNVTIEADGRWLAIEHPDRPGVRLPAELLWRECPSAQGRRRRMDEPSRPAPVGVSIMSVQPIGNYGVNIGFSDGHARGIFPWTFLIALADRPTMNDFISAG